MVRPVIYGIALALRVPGVALPFIYLENRATWDIQEPHPFFDGLVVVVGKVAIWYGPIVEFRQTVDAGLTEATLPARYILFLTLPGALIMKNALFKIEEFVYGLFSRLGTLLGSRTLTLRFTFLSTVLDALWYFETHTLVTGCPVALT